MSDSYPGPSDEVTVSTRAVDGAVTLGMWTHLTHERVEANLTPDGARQLADRIKGAADEIGDTRDTESDRDD